MYQPTVRTRPGKHSVTAATRFPRRKAAVPPRRGTVLVLLVVALVPIMAMMAFAIDVGMLTVAQTQLCDAADAAALAGCRTLNGNTATNNNYSAVLPNVQSLITSNQILGTALQSSQGTVNIGQYAYSSSAQQFQGSFPARLSSGNWNMVQVTIASNLQSKLTFGRIFNFTLPNYQATSTATFRPRDICVILDYSGSMRFSSLLGTPYYGNRSCNNQDTVVPTFGQYSVGSGTTGMPAAAASWPYGNANISITSSDGRPPVIQDFYTNSSGTPAFSAASSTYATTPGGDVPCKSNSGTSATYAQTVAQVLNISSPTDSTYNTTFETQGYKGLGMTSGTKGFQGYTQGPGYWGKTFYYWPPDPTNDWRTAYFNFPTAKADNSLMWDSNGNWQPPSSSGYQIDYTAILTFIKSVGPSIFPSQLQSGRILYYSSIPSSINTSTWPPTDLNQRFWKDYIDYVLGVMQVSSTSYVVINNGVNGNTGYGTDFQWGTVKITPLSSLSGGSKTPYMYYGDNPLRPGLSFWFGPMTMVDFLGNYNLWYTGYGNDASRYCWWPGTCHESPMYACKLGIQAAMNDMQNNHPNDMISLIMFSTPLTSSSDTGADRFNRVRVGLSQSYTTLTDSLWYPPATVGNPAATVTPYDSDNLEVPRAMGGTCYAMALMQAYNQFSGSSALVNYNTSTLPPVNAYDAGGGGRVGAQKIVIFETDGAPNVSASAGLVSGGAYNSYYQIRYNSANPSASQYPINVFGYADNDPTVVSQAVSLVTQMAAQSTANGFSTPSKPLLFNCIAFGPQITTAGLDTLYQMQQAGNVYDGSNNSLPSYKVINGSASTYASSLQTAFSTILQDGVQVSLIQ